MRHSSTIALAVAQFVLAVSAVELEMDHVPAACKTICQPIGTLSDKCDVDLRSDRDRDEHHLQNQCICTNKSFAVGKIAALCADCMHQNRNPRRDNDDDHTDRDDLHQIDRLLYVCGFTSTTYNTAATSEVASVTVDATRPTDVSQLTTTIDGGWPAKGNSGGGAGGSSATATSSGQSAQPTSHASSGTAPGTPVSTVTAAKTSSSGSQSASASSSSAAVPTVNAAAGMTAQAVYAVGGLVAAAYLLV